MQYTPPDCEKSLQSTSQSSTLQSEEMTYPHQMPFGVPTEEKYDPTTYPVGQVKSEEYSSTPRQKFGSQGRPYRSKNKISQLPLAQPFVCRPGLPYTGFNPPGYGRMRVPYTVFGDPQCTPTAPSPSTPPPKTSPSTPRR
jgi:hypothetical protein